MVKIQRFSRHWQNGPPHRKAFPRRLAGACQQFIGCIQQIIRCADISGVHRKAHIFRIPYRNNVFLLCDSRAVCGCIGALCIGIPVIDQVYLRLHVLPFQLGHIQRVQRLRAADGFECAEARPPQQPRRQSQRDDDRRSVSLQTFHFQFLQHKCFLLRGQPLFPIRTYFLYCSRICACAPRFFCISAQLLQAETKRRGRSRGPVCMA